MSKKTTSFNNASASWEEHYATFFGAIRNSDIQTLETVLTKYPEAVEWQDQKGQRPLHLTFEKRDRDTFLYLLEKGANPNQEAPASSSWKRYWTGGQKYTILGKALDKSEKDYIIPLLQHGAEAAYYISGHSVPVIDDLLKGADKIRSDFLIEQTASKIETSPDPAQEKARSNDGHKMEVLKPIKIKKTTAVKTP